MNDIATTPVVHHPRRGARVLLVEDDLLNQDVALGMLEPLGLHVTLACDGAEAVRLTTAERFDLVLMDIRMPVMDGLAATRAIRAIPGRADMPIIAMSANIHPEDRRHSREAGMDDHLFKPIDPDRFRDELARWLPDHGPAASPGVDVAASSVEAPRAALDAINVAVGLQFFGGRQEAYLRMLKRFMALRAGDAALIGEAIAAGDREHAGRLAHSLKSMAATLGAEPLRAASAYFERVSAEGDPPSIRDAALGLEKALQSACAAISALVAAEDQSRSDG